MRQVDVMDDGRAILNAQRRTTFIVGVCAAAISVLMRLRMLFSPVSVDEGAYLAIARAWAHGRVLYRDVFVDRPQGLLLLFRFWDWLSGGNTASIRVMAMLFGVLLVIATGVIVREVADDRAARWAMIICAVLSAAPFIEGYAANTELLSGAVATAGLAVGVHGLRRQRHVWWFFGSGLIAGLALAIKQSAFDGLVALAVWLVLLARAEPSTRRSRIQSFHAMFAGVVAIGALLVVHGALTGWSRWWTAVAGYRLATQSLFSSPDWENLADTAPYAGVVLGGAAMLAIGVGWLIVRSPASRKVSSASAEPILVLWVFAAAFAFLIGGGYWQHYCILLAAPISALAGVGIARVPKWRLTVLAAVVLPCLLATAWVEVADHAHVNVRAAEDRRAALDQRVANWFVAARRPGDSLYVLCSGAAVYADAHQDPGYPYLWQFEVNHFPHAEQLLVDYLSDPLRAPQYIAKYQRPSRCDPSGRVGQIITDSYRNVAVIGPVVMYKRTTGLVAAQD